MKLTSIEMSVYLTAYACNQPRSEPTPAIKSQDQGVTFCSWEQPITTDSDSATSAKYWAACAVFNLRGAGHPSASDIADMFTEIQRLNRVL